MKTRKYETMIIARPEFEKDQIKELVSRLKERIERNGGQLQEVVDWGVRRLAYPIRVRGAKFFYGNYFLLVYAGDGKSINELESYMKLIDEVVRFQTVMVSEEVEKVEIAEPVWREQLVAELRGREDEEGIELIEPSRQRKLSKEEMYRSKPVEKVAEESAAEKPAEAVELAAGAEAGAGAEAVAGAGAEKAGEAAAEGVKESPAVAELAKESPAVAELAKESAVEPKGNQEEKDGESQ